MYIASHVQANSASSVYRFHCVSVDNIRMWICEVYLGMRISLKIWKIFYFQKGAYVNIYQFGNTVFNRLVI
jgi:hypothetical protein